MELIIRRRDDYNREVYQAMLNYDPNLKASHANVATLNRWSINSINSSYSSTHFMNYHESESSIKTSIYTTISCFWRLSLYLLLPPEIMSFSLFISAFTCRYFLNRSCLSVLPYYNCTLVILFLCPFSGSSLPFSLKYFICSYFSLFYLLTKMFCFKNNSK